MSHIILLGDSIFDNKNYVGSDEPDVTQQIKNKLNENSKITRLAIDGDVTDGVKGQLRSLPDDATHLFLSVGGNDALGDIGILREKVDIAGEALMMLNAKREIFEKKYSMMLDTVLEANLPTTICTIYYPRFNSTNLDRVESYLGNGEINKKYAEFMQQAAMSALAVYNDVIIKQGAERGLPILDLRVLCNDDQDFANPIEPSAIGGEKIASKIYNIVNNSTQSTQFYS